MRILISKVVDGVHGLMLVPSRSKHLAPVVLTAASLDALKASLSTKMAEIYGETPQTEEAPTVS